MVEFGETPVDQPKLSESQWPLRRKKDRAGARAAYFSVLMVDHNVMRLHVAVHDALAVTVVQSLEELKNVVPHVVVLELGIQASEVGVVDIFEYQ